MPRRLHAVGPEFARTAPLRLVFAREMAAAPDLVFRALAEDVPGWAEWFSAVSLARPTEGGAGREIRLKGGTRFQERVVAATAPEVYAYRVDETNVPGIRALLEEWRLTPVGTGTRVQWTFAADGTAPFRFAVRLGRAGLARSFRGAVTSLDGRLTSATA